MNIVQYRNLLGVDRALARITERAGAQGLIAHAVEIVQVQVGHIDGVEAGAGRGMHDPRAGVEQGFQLPSQRRSAAMSTPPKKSAAMRGLERADVPGCFERLVGLDDDVQATRMADLVEQVPTGWRPRRAISLSAA